MPPCKFLVAFLEFVIFVFLFVFLGRLATEQREQLSACTHPCVAPSGLALSSLVRGPYKPAYVPSLNLALSANKALKIYEVLRALWALGGFTAGMPRSLNDFWKRATACNWASLSQVGTCSSPGVTENGSMVHCKRCISHASIYTTGLWVSPATLYSSSKKKQQDGGGV
jgi:hypothetical protein